MKMKGNASTRLPLGKVLPSIGALACGRYKNGLINIVGTGFAVGFDDDKNETLFATCTHVVNEIARIRELREDEGKKDGLADNRFRIAIFKDTKMSWREIEYSRYDVMEKHDEIENDINLTENDDLCLIGVPEIKIPILPLFKENFAGGIGYELGSEVMIIGYPVFIDLQTNFFMPYVLKTIISSSMPYVFERNGRKIQSPRLGSESVIGCNLNLRQNSALMNTDFTGCPRSEHVQLIALSKGIPETPTYSWITTRD
jgi:hypothetical protein